MAKIKTKKQLAKKWTAKVDLIRINYNEAKKHQPGLLPFYKSAGYLDTKKRKERALKRWDNRQETNKENRNKYQIRKRIENDEQRFKSIGSDTVFEAYSGKGRIAEAAILKANEGRKFSGIVIVVEGGMFSDDIKTYTFSAYEKFRFFINKFLKKLYGKKEDVYEAFKWTVEKEYLVQGNELILKYTFTENEE